MQHPSLVQFLVGSNHIPASTAEEIAGFFVPKTLAKNDFLLTEGKICDEYFFMHAGFIRAFAHDTEGQEVTTNFYNAGQVIFEASSFFNRTRSKENIQALTQCEGMYINYEQLNFFFHSMPEFREFGRSILVKGLTGLKNRMLGMITETAEQRYAQLLASNPSIFRHAPLKYIASYLGITDTSLSRIRKEMTVK